MSIRNIGMALAVFALQGGGSFAVVVVTPLTDASSLPYTAFSNDLVESGSSTLSAVTSSLGNNYGAMSNLNNGTVGTLQSLADTTIWETAPVTLTFTLNTSVNTQGYDITSVRSIAAWGGDVRGDQNYSLYVRTVGGSTFSLLGSGSTGSAPVISSLLTFTDSTGTLATGVEAVQMVISYGGVVSGTSVGSAFLEFDVIGTATVPEANSIYLLAGGFFVLCFWQKRGVLGGKELKEAS